MGGVSISGKSQLQFVPENAERTSSSVRVLRVPLCTPDILSNGDRLAKFQSINQQ